MRKNKEEPWLWIPFSPHKGTSFLKGSHEPGRVRIKASFSLSPGQHVLSLQHRASSHPGLSPWKGPQRTSGPALSRSGGETGSVENAAAAGPRQDQEAW